MSPVHLMSKDNPLLQNYCLKVIDVIVTCTNVVFLKQKRITLIENAHFRRERENQRDLFVPWGKTNKQTFTCFLVSDKFFSPFVILWEQTKTVTKPST